MRNNSYIANRKEGEGEINRELQEMEDQAVITKKSRDECKDHKSETDHDNLTSKNCEHMREQAQKIFNEVKQKSDQRGDQNESTQEREKSKKSKPINRTHKLKNIDPSIDGTMISHKGERVIILQRNAQDVSTSKEDLLKIIEEHEPDIIAIQETFLVNDVAVNNKGIVVYTLDHYKFGDDVNYMEVYIDPNFGIVNFSDKNLVVKQFNT